MGAGCPAAVSIVDETACWVADLAHNCSDPVLLEQKNFQLDLLLIGLILLILQSGGRLVVLEGEWPSENLQDERMCTYGYCS